jgi:diaminohydroxyphosphoribosylaminopyrimidine deaminase/5-amino-6-(5-phosphoribosylamino)uracil reductase
LVFGAADPNPKHRGLAAPLLREHGVQVSHAGADARFRDQNRPFLRFLGLRRPWILAKWAMTLDGRTALSNGDSKWVSNEESRRRVHRLRGRCDAVAVGVSTILRDDPLLTCRGELLLSKPPARVIFDSHLRTPPGARVLTNREAPTWIVALPTAPAERKKALAKAGAEIIGIGPEPASSPSAPPRVALGAAAEHLRNLGIQRMLIESGRELVGALRAQNLVDQIVTFIAPKIAGSRAEADSANDSGPAGAPEPNTMADATILDDTYVERIGDDVMFGGFVGLRAVT